MKKTMVITGVGVAFELYLIAEVPSGTCSSE